MWKEIPCRITFSFMAFTGLMCGFLQRIDLSVSIVYMVRKQGNLSTKAMSDCIKNSHFRTVSEGSHPIGEGEFDWNEEIQGWLLGAFFWGFILPQILGGRLAEHYGGKHVFGTGMLLATCFTLMTPLAARNHVGLVFVCRFMVGLGQGVALPSIHSLIGKWIPPHERSRITTCCYTGQQCALVFGMPLAGFLCKLGFEGGWPSVFYVFGLLSFLWYIGWLFFVYNSPAEHAHISQKEKEYIDMFLPPSRLGRKMPWKAALKSKPLWGIIVAHFGQNWGFYTMLTQLPSYIKNILGFDIEENGILSSLPYIVYWISGITCSFIGDTIIRKRKLRVGTVRKIFNSIGLLGPALSLFILTFMDCHIAMNILCFIVSGSLNGALLVGFLVNHIDIANNFAGTLWGVTNTLATIPGIFAPLTVGLLTKGQQTRQRWYIAFYICSGIYLIAAIVYIILGSGENQKWNDLGENYQPTTKRRKSILVELEENGLQTIPLEEEESIEYRIVSSIDDMKAPKEKPGRGK